MMRTATATAIIFSAVAFSFTSVTLIGYERSTAQAKRGQLPSCVEYFNENTPRNSFGDTDDTTTVTNGCSYEVGVKAKRRLFLDDNCKQLAPGESYPFRDSGHGFAGIESC